MEEKGAVALPGNLEEKTVSHARHTFYFDVPRAIAWPFYGRF
jgi:hypothetical protein